MKKIGAYIGKFYPPHIGHIWVVDNILKDFDKLYIVISYNKLRNIKIKEEQGFDEIDPRLIKKWFKEYYKNNKKVVVEIFDETSLRPYPQDRELWAKKFKNQFGDVNYKIADESYREYNEKFFPEYVFYSIPRDVVPIHSTQIRKNILNNINNIIPTAKGYFLKKIKNNTNKETYNKN